MEVEEQAPKSLWETEQNVTFLADLGFELKHIHDDGLVLTTQIYWELVSQSQFRNGQNTYIRKNRDCKQMANVVY